MKKSDIPNAKRFRQGTIMECFENAKKRDNLEEPSTSSYQHKTSEQEKMRELRVKAAEKRMLSQDEKITKGRLDNNKDGDELSKENLPLSSQELFTFSQASEDEPTDIISDENNIIPDFNRIPDCMLPLLPLKASTDHTVLIKGYIPGKIPVPYPECFQDIWDYDNVKMPCSNGNQYVVEDMIDDETISLRWDVIENSLLRSISSSVELEEAIFKYNRRCYGKWDFRGLHSFFNEALDEGPKNHFFNKTLPSVIRLALQLPSICTQSIPLLKTQIDHKITFSQKQIACLLANAFLCTFPKRNVYRKGRHEYTYYPDINFNRLYAGGRNGPTHKQIEKLKCIINYFERVTKNEPVGTVTFHRKCFVDSPTWSTSTNFLKRIHVCSQGLIEEEGFGMLQVDFANKYVGGGVLGQGCVQEEIRFVLCPELLVSRLFTERLRENEALLITGVEQFNKYKGYATNFTWDGDFEDKTARDDWGRRCTQVIAIDALPFHKPEDQYKMLAIQRELTKAYVGFYEEGIPEKNLSAIATGNWGCGAFKGDPRLKFLIQWMAASEAGRDMVYFTFGNKELKKDILNITQFFENKAVTVGDLWTWLSRYSCCKKSPSVTVFDFVINTYGFYEMDTDEDSSSFNDGGLINSNDAEKKSSDLFDDFEEQKLRWK